MMFSTKKKIAIIGCGNIGTAIANGLVESDMFKPSDITLTRRRTELLKEFKERGYKVSKENKSVVKSADIIILAVTPQQLNHLADEIKGIISEEKVLMSVVSGVSIKQLKEHIDTKAQVVRVMPNTAIAIKESMTCLCSEESDKEAIKFAEKIFSSVGKTVVISEEFMGSATALCACGTAFFLRAVRAASQGGIEIGFHAEEALLMAAQTAKGAASILLKEGKHPEREIDKVTTPQGITISGLNQMEHSGFSSSMIKGIVTASEKAEVIYSNKK